MGPKGLDALLRPCFRPCCSPFSEDATLVPHLRSARLAAALVAILASCTPPPGAVRGAHRPGRFDGTETFVVDEMMFDAPAWPSRVEGTSFILETGGACAEKRFMGMAGVAGKRQLTARWKPTNTCTAVYIEHAKGFFTDNAQCEKTISEEVDYGVFRHYTDVVRSRLSLAGRPATRDELTWGVGGEAGRAYLYQLCWEDGFYGIVVSGMVSNQAEIDRANKLLVATLEWVDPDKMLGRSPSH